MIYSPQDIAKLAASKKEQAFVEVWRKQCRSEGDFARIWKTDIPVLCNARMSMCSILKVDNHGKQRRHLSILNHKGETRYVVMPRVDSDTGKLAMAYQLALSNRFRFRWNSGDGSMHYRAHDGVWTKLFNASQWPQILYGMYVATGINFDFSEALNINNIRDRSVYLNDAVLPKKKQHAIFQQYVRQLLKGA